MNPDIITKVKKNFLMDSDVAIPVMEDPYFDYFIDLFDTNYKTKQTWNLYKKDLDKNKDWDVFLSNRKKTFYNIIDSIKNHPDYIKWTSQPDPASIDIRTNVQKWVGDIYLSIDLKQANFNTVNSAAPAVFENKSWEDFVKSFEDSDFLAQSKPFRQAVFGKLNPKNQTKIQRNLINSIYLSVSEFDCLKLISAGHDELILCISDFGSFNLDEIKNTVFSKNNICDKRVKFELFMKETYLIKNSYPERKVQVKTYIDSKTLKQVRQKPTGIPHFYLAQFVKYLNNKKIEPFDLLFRNEDGLLTRFVESIDFVHLHLD